MAAVIDLPRVWCENCREEIAPNPNGLYRACACPGVYFEPRAIMGVDGVKGTNYATEDANRYASQDGAEH